MTMLPAGAGELVGTPAAAGPPTGKVAAPGEEGGFATVVICPALRGGWFIATFSNGSGASFKVGTPAAEGLNRAEAPEASRRVGSPGAETCAAVGRTAAVFTGPPNGF